MLCGSFPHVDWEIHQYALCLSGLMVSHLVQAKMLPPTTSTSPLSRVGNGQSMFVQRSASSCWTCQCKLNTWPCLLAGPKTRTSSVEPLLKKIQVPNLWNCYSRGCCCCCKERSPDCCIGECSRSSKEKVRTTCKLNEWSRSSKEKFRTTWATTWWAGGQVSCQ